MSRYNGDEGRVYIGDLPRDASEREIERVFREYGSVRSVWVARNPPGFAFVMFEDERDAEDAVKALDGRLATGISLPNDNLWQLYASLLICRLNGPSSRGLYRPQVAHLAAKQQTSVAPLFHYISANCPPT